MSIKEATHLLRCKAGNRYGIKTYYMNCIPLSEIENGMIKVLVFGRRSNCRDKKQSHRYVEKSRVISKQAKLFY